jgi:hypothetical protein
MIGRINFRFKMFQRSDEESACAVLKIEWNNEMGMRLNADEPFTIVNEDSHDMFDFHVDMKMTMTISGEREGRMT